MSTIFIKRIRLAHRQKSTGWNDSKLDYVRNGWKRDQKDTGGMAGKIISAMNYSPAVEDELERN